KIDLAVSTASGPVFFGSEKVQGNVRLIADNPAVVRYRRNVKQLAGFQFNYATIIERNCRSSRKNEPDMFNRAARPADTGANVLAPFPPGLICRTSDCDSAEVHQLKFALLHHAHFIRRVERFQNDRYLLTIHTQLNIENLSVKSKATFRIHCDDLWTGKSASRPGDFVPETKR